MQNFTGTASIEITVFSFAVHRGRMMPILTELVNSKNSGESQLFIKYEQM